MGPDLETEIPEFVPLGVKKREAKRARGVFCPVKCKKIVYEIQVVTCYLQNNSSFFLSCRKKLVSLQPLSKEKESFAQVVELVDTLL